MTHHPGRRYLPPLFHACLLLVACVPTGAIAGGPANDDWIAREVIASLPATDFEGAIGSATLEPSDPVFPCRRTAATQGAHSIWYSYTTGAEAEYVNVAAAGFDALVAIYRGDPADGFELVTGACNDDGAGGIGAGAALVGIRLDPGIEYSIEVATFDSSTTSALSQLTISAARTYAVTKTADTNDLVCDSDCSLREAVHAANQDDAAVLVPAGTYTITRAGNADDLNATGDLDVLGGVGIYGAGTTATIIDAGAIDRALHLDPTGAGSYSFAIADLTLTNGTAANGGLVANVAGSDADFVGLSRVRVANAVAAGEGGGARLDGFSRIEDSTFAGNRADNDGGAICATGNEARLEILRSTLSGNESRRLIGGGGAVFLGVGTHRIDSSTLSGNTARGGGGGVFAGLAVQLAVRNSTIVDNRADALGTSGLSGGGLWFEASGAATVANSILAGNRRGTGSVASDCALQNAAAPTTQDNLVQVPGNCGFSGSNDVTGIAPGLGPLAANGGPTATHLPAPGSVVVDTGGAGCGNADQRGEKRPTDGDANGTASCDRGAVETVEALVFRNGFE